MEEFVITAYCGECGYENEAYYEPFDSIVQFRCENCGHITRTVRRNNYDDDDEASIERLCDEILGEDSVSKKRKVSRRKG